MGDWQVVVSQKAVLFDEGEVLVVRDAAGGDWEFPGGRIDRDERALAALRREIREETGLEVEVEGPTFTATRVHSEKRGRFFVYYRGTADGREVRLSDEHDEFRWLSPAEAADRLSERRRTALERTVEALAAEGTKG